MYRDLISDKVLDSAALIAACVGELGNNSYDHNIGMWQNQPGCWFSYGLKDNIFWVAIADQGQGVLSSLKRIDSTLLTDQQAVDAAFTRIISGRAPEKRGNGLKFVRSVLNENLARMLFFISGTGMIELGRVKDASTVVSSKIDRQFKNNGIFATLAWRVDS